MVKVERHVSRDEHIKIAVAVKVGPRGSGHKTSTFQLRPLGHVDKLALPCAVIDRVAAKAGGKKIENAVVVDINGGDAHSPAFSPESGRGRDVLKFRRGGCRSIDLAVERDEKIASLFKAFDRRTVDRCDVKKAVAVTIKNRSTAAH